jgi:hypothetical protein
MLELGCFTSMELTAVLFEEDVWKTKLNTVPALDHLLKLDLKKGKLGTNQDAHFFRPGICWLDWMGSDAFR